MSRLPEVACLAVWLALSSLSPLAQGLSDPSALTALLGRIGARVEQYYERAQSIVCDERVRVVALGYNSLLLEPVRDLEYELRLDWEPAAPGTLPEATVRRRLLRMNGQDVPSEAEPRCLDPKAVSPDPLAMLLPDRIDRYTFELIGRETFDGRPAFVLDYEPLARERGEITFTDDCLSVTLPYWTAGRLWVDAQTLDVLRLDERLAGLFEFRPPEEARRQFGRSLIQLERADSSTRYQFVPFEEPAETLLLPADISTFVVWRGASPPRLRTIQQYDNCRRFLTESRILPR